MTAVSDRVDVVLDRLAGQGAVAAYGGPVAAVALALRFTSGAWGGRSASGDDVMAHVMRTHWGIDQLLLHGRLDGWMPSFALGYQEFLFFGPGFTWILALLRLVTFGFLSDAGALKVLTIGSFVTFPLAVVFLARSYGLSRRAAGLAAPLSLLISNPFGIGLSAVFQVALVPQQVGAIFACLSLGAVLRTVAAPRGRWTLLAALSSSALLVTHVISVFIVALLVVVSVPTLLLTDRPRGKAAGYLAWAALGTIGLSSFWLVPFLAHRNLHGPVTTWATPPLAGRLGDIFKGNYLVPAHVALIVVAGMLFAVARVSRNRRWAMALVTAPVGYVAVSRLALHRYPGNEIAIQIENRGMGYVAVIALFGLAAGLAWVTRRAAVVGDVIAVAAAVALVMATTGPWRHVAAQQPPGSPQIHHAAAIIATVVPPGARYAEVREFPADVQASGGLSHPDFWLAWASGRPALNEFNVESSSTPTPAFLPEHLLDQPASVDADALARLGVTDVVTTTEGARTHLISSARFRELWREAPFAVLAVTAGAGQPDPASLLSAVPGGAAPLSAHLVRAGAEHLTMAADASLATAVTVAVAWSPKWHARVDGHAVALGHTSDGLLELALPAGRSTIDLQFSEDVWDHLGVALTALTLTLGGRWVWRRSRQKGPDGEGLGGPAGTMAP
jgi:hypothetical protein